MTFHIVEDGENAQRSARGSAQEGRGAQGGT